MDKEKNIARIHLQPNADLKPAEHTNPEQFHYYSSHFWDCSYLENLPLYPAGVENAIRKTSTWYRDYSNRHLSLIMAPQGEVIYKSREQRFCLKDNQILLIPQGQEFYFETSSKPFYQKLSLFILGVNLPGIMETLELNRMEMIAVPDIEPFIQRILELDKLIAAHNEKDMAHMSGMTMELLYELAENKASVDKNLIMARMIKSRLGSDMENSTLISRIAEELHLNIRTLNRIFQEKYNMTPREYRLNCRLERARDLLCRSNLTIKEIAQKLGYCNQFYFANEFKRLVGVSPRSFRNHQ